MGIPGVTVKRDDLDAALYAPDAAWANLMMEEPADKRVTVSPLAVAIFGFSISIDQAPAELDFGGTNVMVF